MRALFQKESRNRTHLRRGIVGTGLTRREPAVAVLDCEAVGSGLVVFAGQQYSDEDHSHNSLVAVES